MTRRVVITGIGVRTAGGAGRAAFWALLTAGRTATRRISFFDPSPYRSQMAGETDFDPLTEGLTPAEIQRMDRAAQFAVVCANEAVNDSGLDFAALDPTRVGVSLGSAVAAATSLEQQYLAVSAHGRDWLVDHTRMSPYMSDYLIPSVMPAEVAWTVAAQGPVAMVSNGCTSGLDAVG